MSDLPATERDPELEPVPPTQPEMEPEMEPVPPTQPDPRRRWPWMLLGVLVVLAGGAFYAYRYVLRPEPTAHRHVPAGTSVALRADALEILMWKPVREHLWPLAFEEQEPGESRRAKLIEEKTGVRVPLDFREVIIASVDGTSWVAIVGGTIEPGRFVSGLDEVLRAEGVSGWRIVDGELLVHERGPCIGQADDGTIVAATDAQVARAALPASEDGAPEDLPLPREEALSFVVHARAYRGLVSTLPLTLPGVDTLGQIDHLRGTVTLSAEPLVSIEAQPRQDVDAEALARDIGATLTKLRLAMLLITADLYGAKQAIGDAKARADNGRVRIEAPWPYDSLDRAVQHLADVLRTGGAG